MSRKLMIAWLVLILAAMPSIAIASPQRQALFKDVPNTHWALGAIQWGIDNQILDGFPNGTFAPEKPVTEAEFLKILITAYEQLVPLGSAWYDAYYAFAYERQWYLKGLKNQSAANRPILRKNAAILLSSALGEVYANDGTDSANKAINDLYDRGLSNGKTSKTLEGFKPSDSLTRAEAVQFIYQFVNKSGLTALTAVDAEDWSDYDDVTFKDPDGIMAKHELFAQEQKLHVQTYEYEGVQFIRFIGESKEPSEEAPVYFTSSRQVREGKLTWTLITHENVADPADAFEFVAKMFSYYDNYSSRIRQGLAVVAEDMGFRSNRQVSTDLGQLQISTYYEEQEDQYYIISYIST